MISKYDLVSTIDENNEPQSNGYRLINKLGEGTYATVFLAELFDVNNTQEPVQKLACKIIDTLKAPRIYVDKFLPRELSILRKIDHPHIVHVHSIYQKNSKYLIFMRFAENGDLLNFTLRTGAIAENQARVWTKQISLAVQYLHELEIAHRDLKCENILVTAKFNVKVADFGFSRYVLNKKGIRILSETYCGSTSYTAPEILKGNPYNPKVSDIWSLGVVIFVMMNKAMPFDDLIIKKLYEQQIRRKWKFKPHLDSTISKQVCEENKSVISIISEVKKFDNNKALQVDSFLKETVPQVLIVQKQIKELMQNLLEPNVEKRYTISEVLNSEWMFMDHKILGMSEQESLALINAKEERRRMDESILTSKPQGKKNQSFKVL